MKILTPISVGTSRKYISSESTRYFTLRILSVYGGVVNTPDKIERINRMDTKLELRNSYVVNVIFKLFFNK